MAKQTASPQEKENLRMKERVRRIKSMPMSAFTVGEYEAVHALMLADRIAKGLFPLPTEEEAIAILERKFKRMRVQR